jgi:hypothetical protein
VLQPRRTSYGPAEFFRHFYFIPASKIGGNVQEKSYDLSFFNIF